MGVIDQLAKGVVRIAEAAAAVPSGVAERTDAALDPFTVLLDLRLPPAVFELVGPILTSLGFSCEESSLDDLLGIGGTRKVHRCHLGTVELFIVHIPRWILDKNSQAERAAIDILRYSFKEHGRIYIISEGVDTLKIAVLGVFKTWQEQDKKNALLIAWNVLQDLKDNIASKPLTHEQRAHFLKLVFNLDDAPPDNVPAGSAALSDAEKQQLENMLANQAGAYPAGPKDYFVDLIKASNLPTTWRDQRIAALKSIPASDAKQLIDWALITGVNTNPERQDYTVLAEFIERMMGDVGLEDSKTLKRWVLQKPFLCSQAARDAFSAKFQQVDIT